MKTIQDEAFFRRITLLLILCFINLFFDFALSESTWRRVCSQGPRLPDADRVRHCTCQTPEISVFFYKLLFGCFWYPHSFRHVNVKKIAIRTTNCMVHCLWMRDREINKWTRIRYLAFQKKTRTLESESHHSRPVPQTTWCDNDAHPGLEHFGYYVIARLYDASPW